MIDTLTDTEFKRSYIHPESNKSISLEVQTGMYAWHGSHHLEHIKMAIKNPINNYIPVDCGFYDQLVLHAMHKNELIVNKEGTYTENKVTIKDLITKDKEEFVLFDTGEQVRLDKIADIADGIIFLK